MSKKVLAIDFGASSGRGVVVELDEGKMKLTEITRFDNTPVKLNGTLYWDVLRLFHNIKNSLVTAKAYDVESVAIDTWGVDFAIIDPNGLLMSNPVHYRDERTAGMVSYVTNTELSRDRLYEITGIEIMEINTIFQLEAVMLTHGNHIANTGEILFMPDYFNFLLCGEDRTEPCIASTSQILDARTKQWSREIIDAMELDKPNLPGIAPSGTVLGQLLPELCDELDMKPIDVILGCGHDTQCAIAAVPAKEKDFLFLCTGTWCLLGTELDEPIINWQTKAYNLSNETGFGGKTTMLKNIVGLWLVQECRRQWENEGRAYTYAELEELAGSAPAFGYLLDPASPEFIGSGNMPSRMRDYFEFTGQDIPEGAGGYIRSIYESLALKFRSVKEEIEQVTGRKYNKLYLVGGGCKDDTLSQFTANACGCSVYCGPIEATSYGNAAVQFIAKGDIKDIAEARAIIRDSIEQKVFEPQDTEVWNAAYERFKELCNVED